MDKKSSASWKKLTGRGQKLGSKSKEDAPHELEDQLILRLPPDQASSVRRAVQSGNINLRDRLAIELHPDGRHGIVRVDKQPLAARLVDLPCILESHKTIDKKTFYKTADLCQMLVCSTEGELYPPQEEVGPADPKNKKKDKDKEKKFLWNHSITCPLKNVRKRRFRKTAKKKYIESPDVEKEVKRLLSTDAEAVSVRWEVIAEDETKEVENQGSSPASSGHKPGPAPAVERDELREIFNDISSSSEEEEEEEGERQEEELNIMDSEDDLARRLQHPHIHTLGQTERPHEPREEASHLAEFRYKTESLRMKLLETQERRKRQEELTMKVENLALKTRFQAVLDEIKQQEERERQQLASQQQQLDALLGK
uniref:Transcription factor IID n=1 Tax=Callorhinchus milii TaxID=7868 RepID=K4G0I6_CALMI|nr:transcription initiation factor TFIID subunit 7 [Callorhinchus milii]AFK11331.1 transcription factor IID [Callorhinchus milii]